MAAPVCVCHGEPSYWQKDSRRRVGGYWYCSVKARAGARTLYDRLMDDPVWRNQRRMRQAARARRATLARRARPNPKVAELLLAVKKGA